MIYLISGSPRAGKSTLSRKLSKKLNLPYISTDNIMPIIKPYYPKGEQKKKFPFNNMCDLNDWSSFYRKNTPKQIFKADLVEAKSMWKGVQGLIEFLDTCKVDYIIEGFHLLPSYLATLKDNKIIRAVCITKVDEKKILEGLKKNKGNNDWLADNIHQKDQLDRAVENLMLYGEYFDMECKKYKIKLIKTDTDFKKNIKHAMKMLIS